MDFELSKTQRELQALARTFAGEELTPHAAEWDERHHFPVETLKGAGECGFLAVYTPEQRGGMGMSRLDAAIIFEELARGCTSTAAYITIHNMCSWMIATFAPPEVSDRYLPDMVAGKLLSSYCLTEPNSGSDAAALKTRAVDSGRLFSRLTGSKMFISGGGVLRGAGRDGPNGRRNPPGHYRLCCGCSKTEGIEWGKNENKDGVELTTHEGP